MALHLRARLASPTGRRGSFHAPLHLDSPWSSSSSPVTYKYPPRKPPLPRKTPPPPPHDTPFVSMSKLCLPLRTMCRIKQEPSSSCESTSSSITPSTTTPAPAASAKRPAGRTKFRETRHPVFRGVRRRGRAGARWRWVCEVRVPGRRGCRLWLGTYGAPEAAARAHDAAMLALRGACAAAAAGCLNFPDSAWLLDVPPPAALRAGADVRRAVARAVERFVHLRPAADEDAMSATSGRLPAAAGGDDDANPAKSDDRASPFELDVLSDMGAGLYYACMAQGLLVAPPPSDDASCCDDPGCGVAVVPLWSY